MAYCKWLSVVRGCFYMPVILLYIGATFGPNFIQMCAFFVVKSICFGLNHERRGTCIRSVHTVSCKLYALLQ